MKSAIISPGSITRALMKLTDRKIKWAVKAAITKGERNCSGAGESESEAAKEAQTVQL